MLRCVFAALTAAAVGCMDAATEEPPIRVLAAASLTDAFGSLAQTFERSHDRRVELSFAGSQVLRLQIEQGAVADVFASADARHVQALVSAGLADAPSIFARNELVLIVPADAEVPPNAVAGLVRARRLVVGGESVPAGRYARLLLAEAEKTQIADVDAIRNHIVSEENNVRLVRSKVELGEADAALVYRSDAVTSKQVLALPFEPPLRVRADYHHVRLTESSDPDAARTWMDFVESRSGLQVLREHGFSSP